MDSKHGLFTPKWLTISIMIIDVTLSCSEIPVFLQDLYAAVFRHEFCCIGGPSRAKSGQQTVSRVVSTSTQPMVRQDNATQRNATQRNATQRNATQRNATQRNAT